MDGDAAVREVLLLARAGEAIACGLRSSVGDEP